MAQFHFTARKDFSSERIHSRPHARCSERWTACLLISAKILNEPPHRAIKQSVSVNKIQLDHPPSKKMYGIGVHHRINRMAGGGGRYGKSQSSHRSSTTSPSPSTISITSSSRTTTKGGVSLEVRRQLACRRAWRALDFDDLEEASDPGDVGVFWSHDRYDEEEFWSQIQQSK